MLTHHQLSDDNDYRKYIGALVTVPQIAQTLALPRSYSRNFLPHLPLSSSALEKYWDTLVESKVTRLASLKESQLLSNFQNLTPVNLNPLQVLDQLQLDSTACRMLDNRRFAIGALPRESSAYVRKQSAKIQRCVRALGADVSGLEPVAVYNRLRLCSDRDIGIYHNASVNCAGSKLFLFMVLNSVRIGIVEGKLSGKNSWHFDLNSYMLPESSLPYTLHGFELVIFAPPDSGLELRLPRASVELAMERQAVVLDPVVRQLMCRLSYELSFGGLPSVRSLEGSIVGHQQWQIIDRKQHAFCFWVESPLFTSASTTQQILHHWNSIECLPSSLLELDEMTTLSFQLPYRSSAETLILSFTENPSPEQQEFEEALGKGDLDKLQRILARWEAAGRLTGY